MKKGFYFLSLFLLLFIAGNMSVAQAQVYEVDMDNPCITSSAQLSSNCTWTPDKGSDNYLPENNEAFYDKGDYLGTEVRAHTGIPNRPPTTTVHKYSGYRSTYRTMI